MPFRNTFIETRKSLEIPFFTLSTSWVNHVLLMKQQGKCLHTSMEILNGDFVRKFVSEWTDREEWLNSRSLDIWLDLSTNWEAYNLEMDITGIREETNF